MNAHHSTQVLRRVLGVEPEARSGVLRRLFQSLPAQAGVDLLEALLTLRESGAATGEPAMAALVLALTELGDDEVARDLYREALTRGRDDVRRLLMRPVPHKQFQEGEESGVDRAIRELPLGQRKYLARNADLHTRARLIADGHPDVVANLLRHPRLTEPEVIRLAARRPVRAEVGRAVFASPRWGVRPAVRRALVHNPFTPPDLGLKLVFLLPIHEAQAVAADGTLHPEVRRTAQARVLEAWRRRERVRAAAHLDALEPLGDA